MYLSGREALRCRESAVLIRFEFRYSKSVRIALSPNPLSVGPLAHASPASLWLVASAAVAIELFSPFCVGAFKWISLGREGSQLAANHAAFVSLGRLSCSACPTAPEQYYELHAPARCFFIHFFNKSFHRHSLSIANR